MKKSTIAFFVSMCVSSLVTNAALAEDQYYHRDFPSISGNWEQDIALGYLKLSMDEQTQSQGTSVIYGGYGAENSQDSLVLCGAINSGPCSNPVYQHKSGFSILPPCVGDESNCIENVEIFFDGASRSQAILLREISGFTTEGDPSIGVPRGGTTSIWSAADSPHTGGNEYAITAGLNWDIWGNRLSFGKFTVMAAAVQERSNSQVRQNTPAVCLQPTGTMNVGRWGKCANHNPWKYGCVYVQDEICAYAAKYSADTRIAITFRITNRVTGWLEGRLKDPLVSIEAIDINSNRMTISALPAEVAKLHTRWQEASYPGVMQGIGYGGWDNGNMLVGSTGQQAFEIIKRLREATGDAATGTQTLWSFNSTSFGSICGNSSTRISGIVTTNAMAYVGTAPQFQSGYLSYEVAGMHYLPNSASPVLGTYDLLLDAEVARCLYGFTNAPISATVAVVGTGDQNLATTIVSEKDGWLKLAAYGFTFSEKEIQVKLTQPYSKTITKFTGTTKSLTSKQKAEIKVTVTKAKGNPKFICTGTYVNSSSKATALARARAACNYAKSLDKNHSYFAQAKLTKAQSYDGKVMLDSK